MNKDEQEVIPGKPNVRAACPKDKLDFNLFLSLARWFMFRFHCTFFISPVFSLFAMAPYLIIVQLINCLSIRNVACLLLFTSWPEGFVI